MKQMQRRNFLRRLACCGPIVAGATAVSATATKAQSAVDPTLSSLKAGVQTLRTKIRGIDDRLDRLENAQRTWLRVALAAAALSLGIDVSSLF